MKKEIQGFPFPTGLLEEFEWLQKESFPVPASALSCYLTILAQRYQENNPKGIVREYSLSDWAKRSGVQYHSLYHGYRWLMDHRFIEEVIVQDIPALVIAHWEDYQFVEKAKLQGEDSLNYFRVPFFVFESGFLAECVRTSNPTSIFFVLSLFNRFRVPYATWNESATAPRLEYLMSTLKDRFHKKAKDVRKVLTLMESFFDIEYKGVSYRKTQVWVHKVVFRVKEICFQTKEEREEITQLLQKMNQELVYVLDGQNVSYKPQDQRSILFAFKQEAVNLLTYIPDEEKQLRWMREIFLQTLHQFESQIRRMRESNPNWKIYSLGGYFRTLFRNVRTEFLRPLVHEFRELFHEGFMEEYRLTGQVPKLKTLDIFG